MVGVRERRRREPHGALIIELHLRAGAFGRPGAVIEIVAGGAGEAGADDLLPGTVEEAQPRLRPAIELFRLVASVAVVDEPLGRRVRPVEILPVEVRLYVRIARSEVHTSEL